MNQRPPKIGPTVQRARKARGLTLEQLATKSGVSKSMLSQIERGEANPTFAVVWSLTQALDIDFATLAGGAGATSAEQIEVTSRSLTPEIRSPDGLCRLRILSPPRLAGQTEWYELEMQPGAALVSDAHAAGSFEHYTAMSDGFTVKSGGVEALLHKGETARYAVDVPHTIRNDSGEIARGFLVVLYR
ncbi:MAG: XRE family transcriptional regulator [Devosia indica]